MKFENIIHLLAKLNHGIVCNALIYVITLRFLILVFNKLIYYMSILFKYVCITLSTSMSLLVCSYYVYSFETPFTSMVLIQCENRIKLITQSFHIPLIVTRD